MQQALADITADVVPLLRYVIHVSDPLLEGPPVRVVLQDTQYMDVIADFLETDMGYLIELSVEPNPVREELETEAAAFLLKLFSEFYNAQVRH